MYTLADLAHEERGWGLADETFHAFERMAAYGEDAWFQLGDRDLATHLTRTRALRAGEPLHAVTARLCRALSVQCRVLPMCDGPCRTMIETREHGALPFQTWFVRHRTQPTARGVRFEGSPPPAPGVLEAIEAGATHMFIVPAALQMVVQHPRAPTTDFSNLKYLMYGAAPMPLELLKEAVRTMPTTKFLQAYGMTETSGTISILPPEDHSLEGNQRMRSAGKACPGVEIEVRSSDNVEVPRGEIGEVCIRSPSNTLGYWKLPEATAKTIDADGWLHTGDAGVMDEDGYVYIQDRIKDMIISGGENVYPAEVESAIYGHPAIAEVAVIGVPSAKWGEEVKACVVAKPGMEVDEADVIAWARERIAAFKAPKSVDVIPLMPRNASGKILRRELRAPYWEGQERQVS